MLRFQSKTVLLTETGVIAECKTLPSVIARSASDEAISFISGQDCSALGLQ